MKNLTQEQIALLKELFGKTMMGGGKSFNEICDELVANNNQQQADSLRTQYIFVFVVTGREPVCNLAKSGNWWINTTDAMRAVIGEKLGM
jgi:hypothetical protein